MACHYRNNIINVTIELTQTCINFLLGDPTGLLGQVTYWSTQCQGVSILRTHHKTTVVGLTLHFEFAIAHLANLFGWI